MFKKFLSVLLVTAVIMGCMTVCTYASRAVKGGFCDDFESYDENLTGFFSADGLWKSRSNTETTSMVVTSDAAGGPGNKHLDLVSAGDGTILLSNSGILNNDVSIISFKMKSSKAGGTTNNSQILLRIGDTEYTIAKATYSKLRLDSAEVTSSYTSWNSITAVIDNVNHKMTVTSGTKSETIEIPEITAKNAYVRFKVSGECTLSLDDVLIADKFYHDNDYSINEDFERIATGVVSSSPIATNIKASETSCTEIVYDSAANNKYVTLQPTTSSDNPVLYSSSKITADKTVLEFDAKMGNSDGQFGVYIRMSNGSKTYLMRYNMGTFTLIWNKQLTDVDICGSDFVKFKFCISKTGNVSAFVNGKYVTYYNYDKDLTGTDIRFQCNYGTNNPEDVTLSKVCLDNIKMYIPPVVQLRPVVTNTENVGYSDYIEFVSNNPLNTGAISKDYFTVNGSNELINKISASGENLKIYVKNGLMPNSQYTVAAVANKVKDYYDQYIDLSHAFTTNTLSVSTELKDEAGEALGGIADANINVVSTVSNSGEAWPGVVVYAHYRNGEMVEIKVFEDVALANEAVCDKVFACEANDSIKVFVWDAAKGMYPLFKDVEFK